MEAGDLRIDRRVHHEGNVHLPLSHYHGLTIGFVKGDAQVSLKREMPSVQVDLDALSQKFCPGSKEFLLRANEPLNMIFTQLYRTPKSIRQDYFKLKITELLLLLSTLDPSEFVEERQYFPAQQTDKIKEIHALLTGDLGRNYTIDELSRFWDVDEGAVKLGGHDVREYSMDALMKNFSFVFQRVYLFQDTIANNIRFGQPEAPMEKVIEAAKKACCHDFIMQLPDGYDTVIGEGGASLSGGEKQRISIARAIMKNSPIIVLDEATANVDPENEAELMNAVEALTKEKTVIMIAHRLKTVRSADRILVIDSGKIAQQGTHDELMRQDGIYRTFVAGRREAASWRL